MTSKILCDLCNQECFGIRGYITFKDTNLSGDWYEVYKDICEVCIKIKVKPLFTNKESKS